MNSAFSVALLALILTLGGLTISAQADRPWVGVDESVVERFAEEAGRPARDPFINTDQGDLLLFAFLLAGAAGGLLAGYHFREVFPPKSNAREKERHV